MAATWPCEEMRSSQRLERGVRGGFLLAPFHSSVVRSMWRHLVFTSSGEHVPLPRSGWMFVVSTIFGDGECAETASDKRWSQERQNAPFKIHLVEVAIIALKQEPFANKTLSVPKGRSIITSIYYEISCSQDMSLIMETEYIKAKYKTYIHKVGRKTEQINSAAEKHGYNLGFDGLIVQIILH